MALRYCRASFTARRHYSSRRLRDYPDRESEQKEPFGGVSAYADDPEVVISENEATAGGHAQLRQQRQVLYHLRLIEHEMPHLVAFRKPFVPPTKDTPLVMRSISYGGEEHPATVKRVIVTPVAHLPLKDNAARHNLKLIAGSRWTPHPPRDSGIGTGEDGSEHGYVKVSCEDFPRPAMNLKWASDLIDRLVVEANNAKETMKDIPIDTRHVDSKARKARKGEHHAAGVGHRPSIRDFPLHWLPDAPAVVPTSSQS